MFWGRKSPKYWIVCRLEDDTTEVVGPRDRSHKRQNGVEEKRDITSYILTQNVTGISLELSAAVNYVLSEQV